MRCANRQTKPGPPRRQRATGCCKRSSVAAAAATTRAVAFSSSCCCCCLVLRAPRRDLCWRCLLAGWLSVLPPILLVRWIMVSMIARITILALILCFCWALGGGGADIFMYCTRVKGHALPEQETLLARTSCKAVARILFVCPGSDSKN